MIAFTFPGQGSQKPGMGKAWQSHPSWDLVTEASEASGRDVASLLLDADAEELKQTRNSQLATFVLSSLALDAVERLGVVPARLAGHSLGEYTALVAAGAFSFADGVKLVTERGEAMQAAADENPGGMAAVLGLDDDRVETVCAAADGDVWVANFNGPGQVVIAGDPEAVEACAQSAKRAGAKKAMVLPVGGAFHTPFMTAAHERLAKAIGEAEIRDCTTPVWANVDAEPHVLAADWQSLLTQQLTSPVRWRHTLYNLGDSGVSTFVELGPGKVLTGLAKRTIGDATAIAVAEPSDLEKLLETLADPGFGPRDDSGESVYLPERLVVSPTAGVFKPADGLDHADDVDIGDFLGSVGDKEVRSPFKGTLAGILAVSGERLVASQPIAWLRI